MKSFNLSDWALGHRSLVWYFMIAFMVAGLFAYLQLGRQEDPDFTIKTMVIQAQWPGASPEEMTRQVTDRIEKKLEELESLDYTKSVTVAGQTTVFVYLRDSTKAIAEGRYKAVNMAGAAVIAAVTNALEGREFPFVFGGDGASFAVGPADVTAAREALAATATWVREDLGLSMRIALVPVREIRAQGSDVSVARYGPSANLSYAMFAGGGLGWAEAAMKRGAFAVTPAPPGTQPDLSGLSCRFELMPSSRGLILSVLVLPAAGADTQAYRKVIEDIIALTERSPDAGRPVPAGGPVLQWPPQGLGYEVRAARGGPLFARWVRVIGRTLFVYAVIM
ncbi:MAG: DUF3095 family protein [Staphylococcus warneri]|nr:DUF3095 family protein [Staphylococcus warneri]